MNSSVTTPIPAQQYPTQKTALPKKTKKEPEHPAMKQAMNAFARLHGHKFAANAGRGFKSK